MPFVIRTDKLSKPFYFAGVVPGAIGFSLAISPVIFNAHHFDSRKEAEGLIETPLGPDWTISPVEAGMTRNLRRKR